MFLEASGDTYADAPRLLARHRDAGPGIRRARVVASRARAAFLGSRRGDGDTGVSGSVPHGTLLFLVQSSLAVPQACRSAAERADNVRHEDHPFWVHAALLPVLQFHHGVGLATFPPSKERRPGLLAPIHPRSVCEGDSANFGPRVGYAATFGRLTGPATG